VSPLSYFKITSYQDFGESLVRMVATPLVLHLTFRCYPFGFKLPLILEPAIMYLEIHVLLDSYGLFLLVFPPQTDNPHCPFSFPFLYEVILDTTGSLISHLYTRVQITFRLFKPQTTLTLQFTLSPFRGLFNDHIRPIIFLSYLRINPKVSSSTS
jgi:hypothetical protein